MGLRQSSPPPLLSVREGAATTANSSGDGSGGGGGSGIQGSGPGPPPAATIAAGGCGDCGDANGVAGGGGGGSGTCPPPNFIHLPPANLRSSWRRRIPQPYPLSGRVLAALLAAVFALSVVHVALMLTAEHSDAAAKAFDVAAADTADAASGTVTELTVKKRGAAGRKGDVPSAVVHGVWDTDDTPQNGSSDDGNRGNHRGGGDSDGEEEVNPLRGQPPPTLPSIPPTPPCRSSRCYPTHIVYDASYGQLNNQVVSFLNAAVLASAASATLVIPPAGGGAQSCADAEALFTTGGRVSPALVAAVGAAAAAARAPPPRDEAASVAAAAAGEATPPPPRWYRRVCDAPQPPLVGPRGYFSDAVLSTAPGLSTTSTAAFAASAVGAAFAAAPSILLAPGIQSGAGMRVYAPNATVVHATPPPTPMPVSSPAPSTLAPPAVLPLPCVGGMWESTVAPWVRSVMASDSGDFPNGGVLAVDHAYYGGAPWHGACGGTPLYSYLAPTPRIVNAAVSLLASLGNAKGNTAVNASSASPEAPVPTEATVGVGLVAVHLRILPAEEHTVNLSTVVAAAVEAIESATVSSISGQANAIAATDGGAYNDLPGGIEAVRGKKLLAAARGIYVAFTPSSPASVETAAALRAKYGRKVFWYSREAALGGAAATAAVDATIEVAAAAVAMAAATATAADVAAAASGVGNDDGATKSAAAAAAAATAAMVAAVAAADDVPPIDWMYGPSMVDLWACVLAEHFIGRDASSFSGNIRQWRRGTLRSEMEGGGVRVWSKANTASLRYSLSRK
ncbi:hypothetical protein MMPV_004323 [Pyropia vietnamensis]